MKRACITQYVAYIAHLIICLKLTQVYSNCRDWVSGGRGHIPLTFENGGTLDFLSSQYFVQFHWEKYARGPNQQTYHLQVTGDARRFVISTEIRCFVQQITDEGNVLDVPDTDGFTQNNELTRMLVEQELRQLFLFFFWLSEYLKVRKRFIDAPG